MGNYTIQPSAPSVGESFNLTYALTSEKKAMIDSRVVNFVLKIFNNSGVHVGYLGKNGNNWYEVDPDIYPEWWNRAPWIESLNIPYSNQDSISLSNLSYPNAGSYTLKLMWTNPDTYQDVLIEESNVITFSTVTLPSVASVAYSKGVNVIDKRSLVVNDTFTINYQISTTLNNELLSTINPQANGVKYLFVQIWKNNQKYGYLGPNYVWTDLTSLTPANGGTSEFNWYDRISWGLVQTPYSSSGLYRFTDYTFNEVGDYEIKIGYSKKDNTSPSGQTDFFIQTDSVKFDYIPEINSAPSSPVITFNPLKENLHKNQRFTFTYKLSRTQLIEYSTKNVTNLFFLNVVDLDNKDQGNLAPNGVVKFWTDSDYSNYKSSIEVPYILGETLIFSNRSFNKTGNFKLLLMRIGNGINHLIEEIPIYFRDVACFNEGTDILILNKDLQEEYVPVETLKKGDLVKSYKHGYRRIEMIGKNKMSNNPEKFGECMYRMEKTDTNGLTKDLLLTGWHSVLVDSLGDCEEQNKKFIKGKLDDKYFLLCSVSKDFKKIETREEFTYYHFYLENDGDESRRFGVYSNGLLTETPSKKHYHNKMILLPF